jgi:hypothetical protein
LNIEFKGTLSDKLLNSIRNIGNWPEAIIEKRNETLVAVEVKNTYGARGEVYIENAVKKFQNMVSISKICQHIRKAVL